MCHLWRNEEDDLRKPTIEEWKYFISSFDGFVEKGTPENRFTITFGGGEPLLHGQTLLELVGFCSERGFWTSIASNGYLLNRELIEKFINLKLHYLGLSLDTLKEETHDYLRGVKGSYGKITETIEYLSGFKDGPCLAINAIIMAPNLNDILELTQWAIDKERISSILFQAIMQPFHDSPLENWYRHKEYDTLWPNDTERVKFVMDRLIKIKRDNMRENKRDKIANSISQLEAFKNYFVEPEEFLKRIKCNVLESGFFSISPNGDVNLCPFKKPIGNIKDGELEKLWCSEKAEEIRGEMLLCKNGCHHLVNCWYEEELHG
jgi:MoaA/NifB/PqqE/SkfB family radical SAM enzyme